MVKKIDVRAGFGTRIMAANCIVKENKMAGKLVRQFEAFILNEQVYFLC